MDATPSQTWIDGIAAWWPVIEHWPGLRREHKLAWYWLAQGRRIGDALTVRTIDLVLAWGCSEGAVSRRLARLADLGLARVVRHDGLTQIVLLDPAQAERPISRRLRLVGRRDSQRSLPFDREAQAQPLALARPEAQPVAISKRNRLRLRGPEAQGGKRKETPPHPQRKENPTTSTSSSSDGNGSSEDVEQVRTEANRLVAAFWPSGAPRDLTSDERRGILRLASRIARGELDRDLVLGEIREARRQAHTNRVNLAKRRIAAAVGQDPREFYLWLDRTRSPPELA